MFKRLGKIIISPYSRTYDDIKSSAKTMKELGTTVKKTIRSHDAKAQYDKRSEDPAYIEARKISDDKERFRYLARENNITKAEADRRIKRMQHTQLFNTLAAVPAFLATFYFLGQYLSHGAGFMTLALAFVLAVAMCYFATSALCAALYKTQLQDKDLMSLKRFTNHPRFYAKLLNPLS